MKKDREESKKLQKIANKSNLSVFLGTLYGTFFIVVVIVLIVNFCLPVMQVTGSSMDPTLRDGEIVLARKNSEIKKGDMIAFYYNDKILLKRVIASEGDQIDINEAGIVSIDNMLLEEPYIKEPALGDCDIMLPYQVPEARYFVMGDSRSTSLDSRSTAIGCVAKEQVIGKICFRIWPLERFGRPYTDAQREDP